MDHRTNKQQNKTNIYNNNIHYANLFDKQSKGVETNNHLHRTNNLFEHYGWLHMPQNIVSCTIDIHIELNWINWLDNIAGFVDLLNVVRSHKKRHHF